MELLFCPRCGTRRQPQMGFCTRCGADLAEMEDAVRRGMAARAGVQLVGPRGSDKPGGGPVVTTPHSAPDAAAAGPADEAQTTALPRVRRPQAEAREQDAAASSMWHPDAERTERIGPVQHGGARAPWFRRARPSATAAWFRPIALMGGALAVGAAFLPWVRESFHRTAFWFPARFLVTGGLGPRTVSVGVVLAALAGVGLLISPLRSLSLLRRFLGVLVLAIPVLFATVGIAPSSLSDLLHVLGPGAYTAVVGGLLLMLG